jgi:hypothetical protein
MSLDNEYQDRAEPGSLVGALGMWLTLLANNQHGDPQQLTFAYACPSKSVARNLADFLRDRQSSPVTAVAPCRGVLALDQWRVEGITHRQVQSLQALERLSTGLRLAGADHRSTLVSLAI